MGVLACMQMATLRAELEKLTAPLLAAQCKARSLSAYRPERSKASMIDRIMAYHEAHPEEPATIITS